MRYTPEKTKHITKPFRIYCNGKLLKNVTEADDELGFAIVLEKDSENFVIEGDKIKQRLVTGVIQVVFDDGA